MTIIAADYVSFHLLTTTASAIGQVSNNLLDSFAFRFLVVRSGRLSNLHNLLGE